MHLIWISIFGLLGVLSRYFLYTVLAFSPWTTMGINFIGAFLVGMFLKNGEFFSSEISLAIRIGFLGGLTTFSSFSMEAVQWILQKQYWEAGLYIFVSNVGCFLLTWLGMKVFSSF